MQKFNFLQATTTLKNMYQELIDTLESLLSNNSGTARPTSNLRIGMKFFNETTQVTETLVSLAPAAWVNDDATLAGNAAAYYAGLTQGGTTQDPNAAVVPTLLTNHANSPGQSLYWHITTTFYAAITDTGNRSQVAVSYNGSVAKTAVRHCYNTEWTPWVPLATEAAVVLAEAKAVSALGAASSASDDAADATALANTKYDGTQVSSAVNGAISTHKATEQHVSMTLSGNDLLITL